MTRSTVATPAAGGARTGSRASSVVLPEDPGLTIGSHVRHVRIHELRGRITGVVHLQSGYLSALPFVIEWEQPLVARRHFPAMFVDRMARDEIEPLA